MNELRQKRYKLNKLEGDQRRSQWHGRTEEAMAVSEEGSNNLETKNAHVLNQ